MKYLKIAGMYFGFTMAAVLLLDYILVTADVEWSHSTRQCVGVTTYQGMFFDNLRNENGRYSCENLPEKYNHIWVK